jgi:hypothetical protein
MDNTFDNYSFADYFVKYNFINDFLTIYVVFLSIKKEVLNYENTVFSTRMGF